MKKLKAVILWPYVFLLDCLIGLIGTQSFEEARRISRLHFARIMLGNVTTGVSDKLSPETAKQQDTTKKTYFSRNSH